MENQNVGASTIKYLIDRYNNARLNLLVMILFTLFNIVGFAFESDAVLLFSATVPYLTGAYAILYPVLSTALFSVTALIMISYICCWFFSKKRYGWLIFATILFVIDTLVLMGFSFLVGEFSGILDIIFHIWVLYYLIMGIVNGRKLVKMLSVTNVGEALTQRDYQYNTDVRSDVDADSCENTDSDQKETLTNSQPLREVDPSLKAKIFIETDAVGRHIVYRRIKGTNELVVDGWVYDELKAIIENEHTLLAIVDGHAIEVGYNGGITVYIKVDGEIVAKKKRFF